MQATLEQVRTALLVTSWRGVIGRKDQHCKIDYLNIFPDEHVAVRYPSDTVYPPTEGDPRWTWGPNFEHSAPADLPAIDIAERIAMTVAARS